MNGTPALIFDLDGTLVDTAPDILIALNVVLVREGRRPVTRTDLKHLVGHGAGTMLAEAFRQTGADLPDARAPALIDDYIAHYRAHIADESRPFPGVEATLAHFVEAGARLGVLTNKPQELAVPLLETLGLAKYFAAIHGAGRFSYTKPDARVFHHVVEEVGGEGAGALMIGDSTTDFRTARAARVPVILLTYGYTPDPVETLGADAIADEFAELPQLVGHILSQTPRHSRAGGYPEPAAEKD
ncbi:MAG TPA: HAD-IA family hydrolase [Rhizomicrobium sp.]|jgi:phosphoglycolate phosphatase|nr:HAD-IA family hydrolase [Rhizomicrobium sp.]